MPPGFPPGRVAPRGRGVEGSSSRITSSRSVHDFVHIARTSRVRARPFSGAARSPGSSPAMSSASPARSSAMASRSSSWPRSACSRRHSPSTSSAEIQVWTSPGSRSPATASRWPATSSSSSSTVVAAVRSAGSPAAVNRSARQRPRCAAAIRRGQAPRSATASTLRKRRIASSTSPGCPPAVKRECPRRGGGQRQEAQPEKRMCLPHPHGGFLGGDRLQRPRHRAVVARRRVDGEGTDHRQLHERPRVCPRCAAVGACSRQVAPAADHGRQPRRSTRRVKHSVTLLG